MSKLQRKRVERLIADVESRKVSSARRRRRARKSRRRPGTLMARRAF
jgi:hypothetical protein